jgi:hypothetical protein
VVDLLMEQGAPLLGEHEVMPWGCRVVAEDPTVDRSRSTRPVTAPRADGRTVTNEGLTAP